MDDLTKKTTRKPDIGEIHHFAKRDASPGGSNLRQVHDFGWRGGFQAAAEIVREVALQGGSADIILARLRQLSPLQGDQPTCVVCERPREGDVCPCGARWSEQGGKPGG